MWDGIKKFSSTRFKRTNFKAFSFFLAFSLVIWVLVQFSKTYEEFIRVPVTFSHVPKDKIIDEEPVYLDIRIRKSGFKLAWFSLFNKELEIDLTELESNGKELLYVVEDHSGDIRQQLDANLGEITFLDETVAIGYQQKEVKTLPVLPQINVVFEPGFSSNDSLRVSPDSVTISGPKGTLDSLKVLRTVPLELKQVSGSVSGTVRIDTAGLDHVTLYRKEVEYYLDSEKFTEGKMEVPISVINAPEDMQVTIFPKTLTVVFKVSLENFEDITKSDFRVVCDYKELTEGQNFFIPKVIKKPEKITQLRLSANKVQFVIQK